jgi:threonine dehydrogenase-like Zn-dependent dehydrogenase
MKTKAMVLEAFKQPLVMREIEMPPLTQGQVRVQLEAAGVCGSDVHMWQGEDPRTPLPMVLGHEGVGRITELKGIKNTVLGEELRLGDLILWNRGITCNTCYYCAILEEPSFCQNRKVYGINRPMTEAPYVNGCYTEYLTLTEDTHLFKLPEDVDPAIMVSASCSGATIAHGFDLNSPNYGDTVLIQGPGPLGVYAVAFAKLKGAKEIIVIGGAENRLQMCKDFGATTILNRRQTTIEERKSAILDLTKGRGVDLIIEAAGEPSAVREGLQLTRMGGAYLSVGFSQPPGECTVDFFQEVVRKNLKIQGVWVSSTRHTYQAIQLVLNNKDLFGRMITHRYPLTEANAALQVMHSREAVKAVLTPGI